MEGEESIPRVSLQSLDRPCSPAGGCLPVPRFDSHAAIRTLYKKFTVNLYGELFSECLTTQFTGYTFFPAMFTIQ
jgi:hypothetical protein